MTCADTMASRFEALRLADRHATDPKDLTEKAAIILDWMTGKQPEAPQVKSQTLLAGTIVHHNGVPMELVADTTVECHASNFPLAQSIGGQTATGPGDPAHAFRPDGSVSGTHPCEPGDALSALKRQQKTLSNDGQK